MNLATWRGYFEVVKWLHNNRTEGCITQAMKEAAKNDYIEIVNWLHEKVVLK
jgi:hypothetical protein